MTEEETREEAAREREERKIFRAVFGDERGKSVLAWILNECRYFSRDSAIIDPLLMGFCNRLLGKIGVNHAANLYMDVSARVDNANDRDLDAITDNGGNRDENSTGD
jgi:hypothetical protein